MKALFLLFFIYLNSFACTGDCFSCHPSLLKNIDNDNRHIQMKGCINCHRADPESMAECGADCYSCHSVEKMEKQVKEHAVIRACRDCHMKLKEELLSGAKTQSKQKSIKDFLSDYDEDLY